MGKNESFLCLSVLFHNYHNWTAKVLLGQDINVGVKTLTHEWNNMQVIDVSKQAHMYVCIDDCVCIHVCVAGTLSTQQTTPTTACMWRDGRGGGGGVHELKMLYIFPWLSLSLSHSLFLSHSHTHTHIHMHTCIHPCMHRHRCTWSWVFLCTNKPTQWHVYSHIYALTWTHLHIVACTHSEYIATSVPRSDRLGWLEMGKAHISRKAGATVGFLHRNLRNCPKECRRLAYIALVWSRLEYAETVWDPYY